LRTTTIWRRLAVGGLLAVTTAVGGIAAPTGAQHPPAPAVPDGVAAQIAAIEADKADRTPAERKVDSNLLYAAAEEAHGTAVEGAPDLESGVDVEADGTVEVDITATVDDGLLAAIEEAGGQVVSDVPAFDAVRAELPVEAVATVAADRRVRTVVPAGDAQTNSVGAGANEADVTHGADQVRGTLGLDGAGVKACALSDGVNSLAARRATGDLPVVDVLPGQAGSGDEGTAMLELIHDIAPGAELGFATAVGGQAQFAQNILDLEADGCDVIVDDVTYFAEAAFQDDDVARAISQVRAAGVLHFTSAGNSGNLADGTSGTWQGDFQDVGPSSAPLPAGLRVHGWGVGATSNPLTAGDQQAVTLHWSDPLEGSANDHDLYVLDAAGTSVVASSTTDQTGTQDPYERVQASADQRLVVTRDATAAPRYLAVYTNRGRLTHATGGATYGHNASVDAVSTAATPAADPAEFYDPASPTGPFPGQHSATDLSQMFSSDGPVRSYYAADGTPLTPGDLTGTGGVERNGIDITAADGAETTTPGFERFYGTSAAAPNAAAIAALALSGDPTLTPDELEAALVASAIDVEAPGVDPATGAGIVMAPATMAAAGVADDPFLRLGDRTIAEVVGDGDGVQEPGEVFDVTQVLRNDGVAPATTVAATLSTSSPHATVVAQVTPPPATLAPGSEGATTWRVRIDRDCPCGARLPFTWSVTYDGGGPGATSGTFEQLVVGGTGTPVTSTYQAAPVPIPDGDDTGASVALPIGAIGNVGAVEVTIGGSSCSAVQGSTQVGIDHSFVGDLTITLTSPDGTTIPLMAGRGGSGNNLCQTVFSDAGSAPIGSVTSANAPFTGTFRPEEPLSTFFGEDAEGSWTLRVLDGFQADTGTIRVVGLRVTPVTCDRLANTAPAAVADAYDTPFGAELSVPAPGVLANDSDPTSDPLTAELVDDVDDGTLGLDPDGSFTYTPDEGFSGTDTFTYRADDGELSSPPTTVTITVGVDPNQAPTALADTYGAGFERPLAVAAPGVLGNDSDPDDDALSVALVEDVEDGTLALNPNGSFIYIPDDGFSGTDTFTYRASDGKLASAPATVTITVGEQPNRAPVALADGYTTPFATQYHAAAPGVLANDTDADDDPLTATLVDDVDHGDLTLLADGTFTYTPDGDHSGADTFTYTAGDGELTSTPATVTITTGPRPNAAPAAVADAYDVAYETTRVVTAPGVLDNDPDPDGDPTTAAVDQDVAHGTLVLAANGALAYTPDDGFVGTDTFTYTATDGTLTSAPATVTFTVTRSTDAFVDALYRDFLGRPAEADGLAFWGDRLLAGQETRASAARKVSRSSEYAGIVTRRAYLTYLGRPGDAAGVAYWAERVRTGLSVTELPVHLMGSPEFAARAGGTPGAFVDSLFQAVLGRAPSAEERSERVAALTRGTSRATVARVLHAGVESRERRVAVQFELLLDRAPTASELALWVGRLATQDDRDLAVALAATQEYLERAED
jgi:subtilisin-like proprotein convertase family protein